MIPNRAQVRELAEPERPINAETREMLADVQRRGYVDERWAGVILANGARAEAEEAAAAADDQATPDAGELEEAPEIRAVPNEPTVIEGPADRGDAPRETIGGDCE